MLSETDIARIATLIARSGMPLAVGTFGSYSLGSQRPSSDLDLFVITETTLPPPARRKDVQRLLFGVLHPLDIHVFTPEEFEEEVCVYLSFPWVIVRQAKIYFWAPQAAARVPSLAGKGSRRGI